MLFLLMGLVYGVVFVNDSQSEAFADDGIMTLADATASLTVGGSDSVNLTGNTTPGNVAYTATNVNYTATDVSNYNVKVSYANGSSSLKGLATGATTIGNAENKAPSTMIDNTWGYAWTDTGKTAEADYAGLNYQTMPAYNSGTTVASGNSSITNGSGRIVFAAKFGSGAVSGHYKTEVLVSLIATPPLVTYTLIYDENTTDTVSNMPSNQTCQTTDSSCSITISSNAPTRTGYNFKGWSTSSGDSNSVTNAAGSSITMTGNKTIYAVWESQNKTFTINFNANGGSGAPAAQSCTTASASDTSCTITLSTTMPTRTNYNFLGWSNTKNTDTATATASTSYSPGKTGFALSSSSPTTLYAVWRTKVSISSGFTSITNMQQMTSTICSNAAIGATKTLTDARTGNYTYTVTKLADGKCWMTQNLRLAGGTTLTSANSNVSTNFILPASTSTFNSTDPVLSGSTAGQMMNSTDNTYGAYYSYNAATAGTKASATSGSSTYDICPLGWRLPTKDEYVALASALGANNDRAGSVIIRGTPNSFVSAGLVLTSGLTPSTSNGYYWSSTINSATNAYSLNFDSTNIRPSDNNFRHYGMFVRCVAK